VHDWRGDYVAEAVRTGHPVVLEILFGRGYELTWQNAQELVALAAGVGNVESLERLFAQRTIAGDADELEESVENALKAAAAEGHEAAVGWLLAKHPKLSKPACPPALLKATAYGHAAVVRQLQRACNVSASSERLQAAGWLGALFNAARGGHGKVVRLLLADEDAAEMLSKVHAGIKRKKDGPPVAPHPEKDPLAIAAARGHLEVVELLMPFRALCAPCAAAAAAAAGHSDAFVMLASGPAAAMLEVRFFRRGARFCSCAMFCVPKSQLGNAPSFHSQTNKQKRTTRTRCRTRCGPSPTPWRAAIGASCAPF
jgi:hypothetical protein